MTEKNGRHPVEVVAEVQSMELDLNHDGSYQLLLKDGSTVRADFTGSQWNILESLHRRGEFSLKIVGDGDFDNGSLQRIVTIDLKRTDRMLPPEDPEDPSIWERLEAIANSIPEEELAKIPTDFSANYKHYLYGWPKRDDEGAE